MSTPTGDAPFEPDMSRWDPWRPEEVKRLLAGVAAPWYVAAGWGLDLFLGGERRHHDDLEIAAPAARFDEIARALAAYDLFAVGNGLARPLGAAGPDWHQTWVRDRSSERWRLDVFREPSDGDTWICRRDPRIRMSYRDLIEWTADGIPFGRPEVILLFKAKNTRAKDDADFAAVLPHLDAGRRAWLAHALEFVHPGHQWLADVEGSARR